MKTFHTEQLGSLALSRDEQYYIYNGLDSCLTNEIFWELNNLMTSPQVQQIYEFELALQAPALAMMRSGIKIDMRGRGRMLRELKSKAEDLEGWIRQLANAVWGKGLNPRSPAQLQDLFYNHMHFPRIYISLKGEKKVSTNRESLEKLAEQQRFARPFVTALLALRDTEKKISVLKHSVNKDGRFYASYNIGGTETGRWSSSKNVFGGGWNAQNITHELRSIYIADPGFKLCYADLEQAESRAVAYLANDAAYIRACESGDLHTTVAMMVWPDMDWPMSAQARRKFAERPCYRHFSYRDLSKRCGHASNYYGTAWTIARVLKVKLPLIERFQENYFTSFPGIAAWHSQVQQQLQSRACTTTPLGRRRHYFGRLREDTTLREAIANVPQSLIADILNLGLYRVSRELNASPDFQILGQVHDAILFQYKEDRPELVQRATKLMTIPVPVGSHSMTIPVDATVGYTWKDQAAPGSPQELKQRPPESAEGLDILTTKAG